MGVTKKVRGHYHISILPPSGHPRREYPCRGVVGENIKIPIIARNSELNHFRQRGRSAPNRPSGLITTYSPHAISDVAPPRSRSPRGVAQGGGGSRCQFSDLKGV